jgi:hypothetical protein
VRGISVVISFLLYLYPTIAYLQPPHRRYFALSDEITAAHHQNLRWRVIKLE